MGLSPGSRLGTYEVTAALGAGAMGEVWRARDTRLSRDVALKVLPESLSRDPERLQRFEREAQVLASLNHPNIAAIYGVEEAGATTALVLELVEGPTLDERIGAGRLSIDDAASIARQVAEALEYAHEHGVVHRDLQPANVKLTADGRVKVLDFGLAKAIAADPAGRSDSAVSPTITSLGTIAGVVLGTAAYMAPEQARGTNVDRRADIWAFGVVLWEMLAGKRLFDDATVSDTLAAVLRAPVPWDELPASVPPGIVRLLKRCLDRDPRKRLRDIGEARIALETLGAEPQPVAAPVAPAATPPRRSIVPWIALAVTAFAAAAIVMAVTRRDAAPKRVVQFQVPIDPRVNVMSWPRISPDGRMLSFIARDKGGTAAVWIRRLDSSSAEPLPGTEGTGRNWWSPDSRYVAFFANGDLKKVPVAGGPAQLIGNSTGADGAWGQNGTILFDGRATDPIRGIPASGGTIAQVTKADTSGAEAGQSWPCFLPDGKHILYLAMPRDRTAKAQVKVATIAGADARTLVQSDSRVEYAAGYLFYVLQGTLVAQAFDMSRLSVTGERIPVAEQVGNDINGAANFSVSDDVLVYWRGGSGLDSDLVWLDRTGREIGKIGAPAQYRDIALSPDETSLAYGLADPRAGNENLWVRDLKRDVASRLTFDPRNDMWPVWSPDGSRIAFGSDRTGHFAIMTKDARGTVAEQPVYGNDEYEVGPVDWSLDGRWMSVLALPATRRAKIFILPTSGERTPIPYLVEDYIQRGARFSPDGRYVVYVSNESGRAEIYVQTYPASGGKWQISNAGGQDPCWRGDGKEIFYRGLGDDFYAVPVTIGPGFQPGVPALMFRRAVQLGGNVSRRWFPARDGKKFLINAVTSGNESLR